MQICKDGCEVLFRHYELSRYSPICEIDCHDQQHKTRRQFHTARLHFAACRSMAQAAISIGSTYAVNVSDTNPRPHASKVAESGARIAMNRGSACGPDHDEWSVVMSPGIVYRWASKTTDTQARARAFCPGNHSQVSDVAARRVSPSKALGLTSRRATRSRKLSVITPRG